MRYLPFAFIVVLTLLVPVAGSFWQTGWYWLLLVTLPLTLLGAWDIHQTKHNLLRNYPLLAHLRWVFEGIRPEIRQYLVESDTEAIPFSREQRALVYERAKDTVDVHPFGTDLNVYGEDYAWLNHSTAPAAIPGNMALDFLEPGELLEGTENPLFKINWTLAQPHSFAPLKPALVK